MGQRKKNIIEVLLQENVCFCIIIAKEYVRNIGVAGPVKISYSANLTTPDAKNLKGFRYNRDEDNPNITAHEMDKDEIDLFKENEYLFHEVQNDKNGAVYELKLQSFKEHYSKSFK